MSGRPALVSESDLNAESPSPSRPAVPTDPKPIVTLGDLLASVGLTDLDVPLESVEVADAFARMADPKTATLVRSPEEIALLREMHERERASVKLPRWQVRTGRDGKVRVVPDAADRELAEAQTKKALGLSSGRMLNTVLHGLVTASRYDKVMFDEERINRMLGTMASLAPRNESEAMLVLQMAIIQEELLNATKIDNDWVGASTRVNGVAKLSRSYGALFDQLRRLRSNGEQRVIVERITVEAGGRAIVGPITPAAIADRSRPQPQLAYQPQLPMDVGQVIENSLLDADRSQSPDRSETDRS